MGESRNPATQFSKENQPEKNGRPKGLKNRSTIARAVFGMKAKYPEHVQAKLKEMFPDMTNNITIEEAATLMQAAKAIQSKDTQAYKALMDSAYGAPMQEQKISVAPTTPKVTRIIVKKGGE